VTEQLTGDTMEPPLQTVNGRLQVTSAGSHRDPEGIEKKTRGGKKIDEMKCKRDRRDPKEDTRGHT
jgi:hypothetical protein